MKNILTLTCAVLVVLSASRPSVGQTYSALWGEHGERWSADSRLPDFSYAGYHRGESPIPTAPHSLNVKDFGAIGDGEQDDTQAFLDAIAAASGPILIPAGRYRITQILEIQKSGVVLRGEGPDKTVLFFPTPLNDIRPNWGATTGGRRTSNYSWWGGLVWVKGNYGSNVLTQVTAQAKRGAHTLEVASTEGLSVGQRIEIFMRDDAEKSLTNYLYSGDPGNTLKFPGANASFVVTLTQVSAQEIAFDRPLRFDVSLAWKPEIRRFEPTVSEVGIEDLCFEFPKTDYEGHFTELGFNAVGMEGVADCWVRNVRIVNADSGFFVGAHFCTITGVTFVSERGVTKGLTGHHGVHLGGGDNLFTDFRFETVFYHDLGVSIGSIGNVFSNGEGVNLSFDHHKRAPYENLFTDIDVGKGTRIWTCGGGFMLGKNCAGRGTFWNIRADRSLKYPPGRFGPPSMNLVAVQTDRASQTHPEGKWFEAIDPEQIEPKNLHEAQLAHRVKD
jgi:Pectate lyase superfamily protein